jgi:Flp pilus assembly protein TadG
MTAFRSPAGKPTATKTVVGPLPAGGPRRSPGNGRSRGLLARLRREERGAALTEFALVLPWLLLLLIGMIDFGKAINYWIDETHLSNEGARLAVVNNNPGAGLPTPKTLQQYLLSQVDSAELHGDVAGTQRSAHAATVAICFYGASTGSATVSPAVGDTVEVLVRYDYNWLRGFPFPGNPSTTITGKSAMRLEAVPTKYSTADNTGTCPGSA